MLGRRGDGLHVAARLFGRCGHIAGLPIGRLANARHGLCRRLQLAGGSGNMRHHIGGLTLKYLQQRIHSHAARGAVG